MPDDSYQPISCALHSEYERLAMQRRRVGITLKDGRTSGGRIIDITTRSGAEYMLLITPKEETLAIRLDRIEAIEASPSP